MVFQLSLPCCLEVIRIKKTRINTVFYSSPQYYFQLELGSILQTPILESGGQIAVFLRDVEVVIKHLQIPVIIILTYLLYHITVRFDKKGYKFLFLGFLFNLAYLISDWLKDYAEFIEAKSHLIDIFDFLSFNLDLISAYILLYGVRQLLSKKKWRPASIIPHNHLLSILFIVAILLKLYICFNQGIDDEQKYIKITLQLVKSFILGVTFWGISVYLGEKFEDLKGTRILEVIILTYAVVQFNPLIIEFFDREIIESRLDTIGFSVGLIFKLSFLYFTHSLILYNSSSIGRTEAFKDGLRKVLAKAFHELGYPIDAIDSTASYLLDENQYELRISGKVKNAIRLIQTSNLHNRAIISSYIRLYHVDEKLFEDSNIDYDIDIEDQEVEEVYNINTIVQMVISMVKIVSGSVKWKITNEYSPGCICLGRLSEFYQIFRNILKNAVEAIHELEGRIHVKTSTVEYHGTKCVKIEFMDNGVGVDEEDIDEIAKEGYTTKSSEGLGRGYGLSIVSEIIQKYGGEILIQSDKSLYNHNSKYSTTISILIPKYIINK